MKAIVTGMIATYPVGGVAWDYGQYALGLEQLGIETYYLEDTGSYAYNPESQELSEDFAFGARFLGTVMAELSPSLARRWHLRGLDGTTYGMDARAFQQVVETADLFLNVSGGCLLREPYRRCPRKIFIDTDPGSNHFDHFPRWDAKDPDEQRTGFRGHDLFFTYAQRLGKPDCPLSDFGLRWRPTRPPVVLDRWREEAPGARWTTVLTWDNFRRALVYQGREYGSKEREFPRIADLPRRFSAQKAPQFEVAVGGAHAPRDEWRALGWSVADSHDASRTLADYHSYICGSRGELSVAKNVYVATRCGWFSCRTVCYLAAGRPVVVQDTGFSELLPTGEGLFTFNGGEDAAEAVRTVERDYPRHQAAAREIARAYFDARQVLSEILAVDD